MQDVSDTDLIKYNSSWDLVIFVASRDWNRGFFVHQLENADGSADSLHEVTIETSQKRERHRYLDEEKQKKSFNEKFQCNFMDTKDARQVQYSGV